MKAVFLDRDGVINNNSNSYYTYNRTQWLFNDGIIEIMQYLHNLGYTLFIITNQGGISKGIYSKEDVELLHSQILYELKLHNISFKEVMICPHHSLLENCLCRKPKPIMVEKMIAKHKIDIANSWFIGDSKSDVEVAKAVGLNPLLIEANKDARQIVKETIK